MRFSIEKKDLQAKIHHLITITPSKSTMSILTNFYIEASDETNTIRVTTTDLEITVIAELKASVTQAGKAVVSAKYFNEMVALLPDAMVHVSVEEDIFYVTCAKSKYQFNCADASQFPLIPRIDLSNTIDIDAMMFKKMIDSTHFAVGNDVGRPAFTGINWIINPDQQKMVATDGKKIAEFTFLNQLDIQEEMSQIVPLKGLLFLDKVIVPGDQKVQVLLESNRIMFYFDNYTIFSHVIDAKFPAYQKVIPKENNNVLIIDNDRLKHSVKRAALLAIEESSRIKLDITNEAVSIYSFRNEEGEANDVIEEFDYQGKPMVTAFNYRFLYSILSAIETPQVKIRFGEPTSPAIILNTEEKDTYKTRFVLMPLRLS